MSLSGIVSFPCLDLKTLRLLANSIGVSTADADAKTLHARLTSVDDSQTALRLTALLDQRGVGYEFAVESIDMNDYIVVEGVKKVRVKWRGFSDPTYEPLGNVVDDEAAAAATYAAATAANATTTSNANDVTVTSDMNGVKKSRAQRVFEKHQQALAARGLELGAKIAEDAMSSLYFVGTQCIVKILRLDLQQDGAAVYDADDFELEAETQRLMADIQVAPNVVDSFVNGKHGYLLTQYWGPTLELAFNVPSLQEKLAVLLQKMRQSGVVHGNVCGANVVVNAANAIALINWGSALHPAQCTEEQLAILVPSLKRSLRIESEVTASPFDVDAIMARKLVVDVIIKRYS
jgi:hypothetical protein